MDFVVWIKCYLILFDSINSTVTTFLITRKDYWGHLLWYNGCSYSHALVHCSQPRNYHHVPSYWSQNFVVTQIIYWYIGVHINRKAKITAENVWMMLSKSYSAHHAELTQLTWPMPLTKQTDCTNCSILSPNQTQICPRILVICLHHLDASQPAAVQLFIINKYSHRTVHGIY